MRRFAHSVRKDTMLQFRCGFYFVGGFVALFYVRLLRQIPDEWLVNLPLLVPAALALNVLMTTFYFVAALVLLEKSEGTLPALAASPLRVSEYLGAKVASLTLLAMAENAHFPFSTSRRLPRWPRSARRSWRCSSPHSPRIRSPGSL
ncbi:MAG: hypothetical protein IH849_13595 [Acidobacteria bacterium]|nr:hypothetical protein [Acidobacteriota bacterium]